MSNTRELGLTRALELPETDALLRSLTNQREHLTGILDDLTEDQLRQPVLPSGWSCLALVRT